MRYSLAAFIFGIMERFRGLGFGENKAYSSWYGRKETVEIQRRQAINVPKPVINPISCQTEYTMACFLDIYAKPSKVGVGILGYARYFDYECGISDCYKYRDWLMREGFLRECSAYEKLNLMTVAELKHILKVMGFPATGKKDSLIQTISQNITGDIIERYCDEAAYCLTEKGKDYLNAHYDCVLLHKYNNSNKIFENYAEYKQMKEIMPGCDFFDIAMKAAGRKIMLEYKEGRTGVFYYAAEYKMLKSQEDRQHALKILLKIIYAYLNDVEYINDKVKYFCYDCSVGVKINEDDANRLRCRYSITLPEGYLGDFAKYSDIYFSGLAEQVALEYPNKKLYDGDVLDSIVRRAMQGLYFTTDMLDLIEPTYESYLMSIMPERYYKRYRRLTRR